MNPLDLRILIRRIKDLLSRFSVHDPEISTEERRISSATDLVTIIEEDIERVDSLIHALETAIAHIESEQERE